MRGSIFKRGDTWTVRWSTTDPATGRRVNHSRGGFVRKEPARPPRGDSAREFLNRIVDQVQTGRWVRDQPLTVGACCDEWIATRAGRLAPGTVDLDRNVVDGWIRPHLGGLPLDRLTPTVAASWEATLREAGGHGGGLSARSVQLAVSTLKKATRWAATSGRVGADPLAGYTRPAAPASSKAAGAWTVDEARRFLEAVADDRLRAAWWLLLSRGLRRGELAGLRWANVDLEAGALTVVETRVVVAAKVTTSRPKTDAGRRRVPLDERLVAELRAWRRIQAEERLRTGAVWTDTGYVFVDELGRPYRPETIARHFARAVERSGVRRIRLHDTRHTAATLMILGGVDSKVVAELLGHASDAITRGVYLHALPGMGAEAGAMLSGLLAGPTVGP